MNILRTFLVLVQILVVGFWPIWLSLLLVFGLSRILKISTLQSLHRKHKVWMYTSVILLTSLLGFGWMSYFLADIPMVFAHERLHFMTYSDGRNDTRDQIHREIWFRMILLPIETGCFSSDEICVETDELLEFSGIGSIYLSTAAKRWMEYLIRYMLLGLPIGFAFAWILNWLVKYRVARYSVFPP